MVDARDFRVLEVLSDNIHSKIMKVLDEKTGKVYVLKTHPSNASSLVCRNSHVNERRALETLRSHSNIIGYHGFCRDRGVSLILEYFEGTTLQKLIHESGSHPGANRKGIRSYLKCIVDGIRHMHSNGVYHCDLKPDNILVSQDGIRIIDFGCSIISSTGVMMGRDIPSLGTPGFMPPEASDFAYTGKVFLKDLDVWAFGCILYYSYTGTVPFVEGFAFDTLRNVRNIKVDLSILPGDVERVLRRIFVLNPSSRYTVEELEEAVNRLCE